jgi:hypothetical protein
MSEKTIIERPGWEIAVFDDGTVNICSIADDMLLPPAEFDALALHAPITRRLLALAKDWKREDDYCPWCSKSISYGGHARNCPRESVLEDIQAMGLYDLEGDPVLYDTDIAELEKPK